MKILVDMDDVLADFEGEFFRIYRQKHPDKPYILPEDRRLFRLTEEYPKNTAPYVKGVYLAPGFIKNLPPIAGGLDALLEMEEKGHQVMICTSPLYDYENCVLEKFEWMDRYLGKEWSSKIILTKDKTLVKGDILIDDKPLITGKCTPEWEHVLYTKPYNQHIADKRRLTWDNWKEVLGI